MTKIHYKVETIIMYENSTRQPITISQQHGSISSHTRGTSNYTTNNNMSNMTTNETTIFVQLHVSQWILIAAFILILLIGVIGNFLVIYAFGYRRKHIGTSTTERLILFLATSDLLSTVFNSYMFLYWTVTGHSRWDFGYIGCKILPALGPIFITVSSGVIIIFAIDRYVAIVYPFRGKLSLQSLSIAFIVNIVLSILSYTHYIYMIDLKEGRCFARAVNDLEYGIPNCTLIMLRLTLFAGVFISTGTRMFLKLRAHESSPSMKSMRSGLTSSLASSFTSSLADSCIGGGALTASHRKRVKKARQSRKIARILITIGTVFILLVFPREIFYLVFNMSWITAPQGIAFSAWLLHLNSWLKVMHTANGCANVFIYAHMHSRFRRVVIRYLYCFSSGKDEVSMALNTNYSRCPKLSVPTTNGVNNGVSCDYSMIVNGEESCV